MRAANQGDVGKFMAFDVFVDNTDRNVGNVLITAVPGPPGMMRYVLIDHGHVFGGPGWTLEPRGDLRYNVPTAPWPLGCITMEKIRGAISLMIALKASTLAKLAADIPERWRISREEYEAPAYALTGRDGEKIRGAIVSHPEVRSALAGGAVLDHMAVFKYSVMRYVDDIVRDEPVNIGVIVNEPGTDRFVGKFPGDLRSVRGIQDKDARDIAVVVDTFRGEYRSESSLAAISRRFQYSLRVTEPRTVLAATADDAAADMYEQFVSARGAPRGGRSAFSEDMRGSFMKHAEARGIPGEKIGTGVRVGTGRTHVMDFVFGGEAPRDLVKIMPEPGQNPGGSRREAALLAVDHPHIMGALGGAALLHAVVPPGGPGRPAEAAAMMSEDLSRAGCDVVAPGGVGECVRKISLRV